jgi:hypothetical protein
MAGQVNFNQEWVRAVNSVKKRTEKTLKEAYEELFSDIITGTPVDTGRLRGNWQTTVNESPSGETGDLDPSGEIAKSRVKAGLASFKLGDNVFFTNNAPYAKYIEYGHSQKQAPIGMVRINIIRFDSICQKFADRNKDG